TIRIVAIELRAKSTVMDLPLPLEVERGPPLACGDSAGTSHVGPRYSADLPGTRPCRHHGRSAPVIGHHCDVPHAAIPGPCPAAVGVRGDTDRGSSRRRSDLSQAAP